MKWLLADKLADRGLYLSTLLGVTALVSVMSVILIQGLFDTGLQIWSLTLAPEESLIAPIALLQPLLGTAIIAVASVLISLPIGLGCALWTTYLTPPDIRRVVLIGLEILSDIPPVVYGFFGLAVLSPMFASVMELSDGRSGVLACAVVSMMTLPAVVLYAIRVLDRFPNVLIESAMALGATRMQAVWWVALPALWPALITAAFLAALRGIADTMVVLLVAGEIDEVRLFGPIDTRTRMLVRTTEDGLVSGPYIIAAILFGLGFVMHWFAFRFVSGER